MILFPWSAKQDWILGGFEYLHADNVIANAGSGGATFRTDDVGSGVQVPFAKLMDGTDGSSAIIPGDATNGLFVQVKASAIPTGASTAAKQPALGTAGSASSDVITVQGVTSMTPLLVNGSGVTQPVSGTVTANAGTGTMAVSLASVPAHAVTNAGTFATQVDGAALTALQLIDNLVLAEDAVAGSGDPGLAVFAVRRDTPSAGAADGDYVNLSTDSTGALRVTGGGGGTQYAEDAAHTTGDSGTMALVVRRDANTSLVGTDGDYAPLQVDSTGNLKVAIISGAGSGGTSATDDAAFSVASGSGTPIMGLADETSPDSVDEGDVGVVRMTLTRALHVNLRDSSGNELAAGNQYAEDVAHTTGDLGTMALAVRKDTATALSGTDGDYTPLVTDTSGRLHVNVGALPAIPTGSNVIGALTANQSVNVAQMNGVTVLMGNGASGTGAQRVTLANDSTGQVTLAAGTAGIGKLTANSGVDIGDVDVASVIPGTGATNLGKAEDAAHTSGDVGVMSLAVRRDANTTLADTTGDYAPLQVDASGNLKVAIISGAGTGGTSATDDAAFTPASGSGTPIMGFADETSPDLVDEGDVGVVRMTLYRGLHVNLRDASGAEVSVGGGTQYNEDTAHTTGDKMTMAGVVRRDANTSLVDTDGDVAPLQVNATGALKVDASSATLTVASHAVTNAGTFVVQAGTAAHDAVVSGNPVRAAGRARTSDYTAVASDDTADFISDLNGKQVVLPYAIPENIISGATAAITDTTNTSVIASAGGSLRNYITHFMAINSHATVGTVVELRDGASTVLYRGYAGPVGGGFSCTLPTPLKGTAATAITASCITTGSNTYVSASGFKAL